MNSQITDLARTGKCGSRLARGLIDSAPDTGASQPPSDSRLDNASIPAPWPVRARKLRREPPAESGWAKAVGGSMVNVSRGGNVIRWWRFGDRLGKPEARGNPSRCR